MQTKFLKPNNPRLTKISEAVPEDKISSSQIIKIVSKMLKIIAEERKEKRKGVGLAAPQIGILKRIILVDVKADGKSKVPRGRRISDLRVSFPKENSLLAKLKVYINPEIIWKSKREGEWYEGCFSTGNVCGIVSRPTSIKIKAIVFKTLGVNLSPPPRWDVVEEKWSGYVARIFQHEIDHLDGKVFVEHIKDPDKLHWVEENQFQLYRKGWKTWAKKCSVYKWKMLKSGTS